MIFTHEVRCDCGKALVSSAYGSGEWSSLRCEKCGSPGALIDPLSVSVIAERLLYRSKQELEKGDYTISILVSAMAVEYFLTGLYQKKKGMEYYRTHKNLATQQFKEAWSNDKALHGSFSDKCNKILNSLIGIGFDEYVVNQQQINFSNSPATKPTDHVKSTLLDPRNRIAHRGYIDSTADVAQLSLTTAAIVVDIFRRIDSSVNWEAFG